MRFSRLALPRVLTSLFLFVSASHLVTPCASAARGSLPYVTAVDGSLAAVGASWHGDFSGKVYLFRLEGDAWLPDGVLSPPEGATPAEFGGALSLRGNHLVVGAPGADGWRGATYRYERTPDGWVERGRISPPDARVGDRWTGDASTVTLAASSAAPTDLLAAMAALGAEPGYPPAAVIDPPVTLVASDSLYESHVELSWSAVAPKSIIYRIYRRPAGAPAIDDVLISVASRNDSLYLDTGGRSGITYTYCIKVLDLTDHSEGFAVCDDGTRVLFRPTSVDATDGLFSDYVEVTWTDRSFIEAGYHVYRRGPGDPDSVLIGTTDADGSVFRDSSAVVTTSYTYCVAAFDAAGDENEPGCDTGYRGYILAPRGVEASDGQYPDRVIVTWVDPTDREINFHIYRRPVGDPFPVVPLVVLTFNTTAYQDSTGSPGVVYDYCVATVDSGGHESTPVCDEGGIGVLPGPQDVRASDLTYDDKVRILWRDASDTEDEFRVYRREIGEPDSVLVATLEDGITAFDDMSAEPTVTYRYCVVAVSDKGGVSTATCDEGTRADILAPSQVDATAGTFEDRVEVTWETSATRAVLYQIYRNGQPVTSVAAHERLFVDVDVPQGQMQHYAVSAMTALGVESDSVSAHGFRTLHVPTEVKAGDGALEDRVSVSWKDNSTIESGYRIYRRIAGTLDPLVEIGTRPEGRTTFQDLGGVPGVVYEYQVVAFHTYAGALDTESGPGADTGFRTLLAPSEVQATDGEFEDRVVLVWTDRSQVEDGFRIYRKEAGTAGDSMLVGTTGSNAYTFTDDGGVLPLVLGTSYAYFVSAFDAMGASLPEMDNGLPAILPPSSVRASDTYTDRVVVVWVDDSIVETGYRVSRNGSVIQTLPPGSSTFTDNGATVGVVYDYCVTTLAGGTASSDVCDFGTRAAPASVAIRTSALTSELAASGLVVNDKFGNAVAMSGDRALVAAHHFTSVAESTGAVYAFAWDGSDWNQTGRLSPVGSSVGAEFGYSVAMDGKYAVIGAMRENGGQIQSGAAYFFELNSLLGTWAQKSRVTPAAPEASGGFGYSVDLSGDIAVVGQPFRRNGGAIQQGRVTSYQRQANGTWTLLTEILPPVPDVSFGGSVALSGDRLLVGSFFGNQAWAFDRLPIPWILAQTIGAPAGSGFGNGIAMDGDDAVILSSITPGVVNFYRWNPGTLLWQHTQSLAASDGTILGEYVALSGSSALVGGRQSVIGAPNNEPGAAILFNWNATTGSWSEAQKYTYAPAGVTWNLHAPVGLAGGRLILGAPLADGSRGKAFFGQVIAAPSGVTATDGTLAERVTVRWTDESNNEDGFKVYRDGVLIETTSANVRSYSDAGGEPGRTYEYAVSSFSNDIGETSAGSDFGRRAPNGTLAGRVSTRGGAGVDSIRVSLDPAATRALLLDGVFGHLRVDDAVVPTGDVSVEFWVRTTDTKASAMVSYASGAVADQILIENPGNLHLVVNGADGGSSGRAVNDGRWHHVALTWIQSTGAAALFVDGEPVHAATVAAGTFRASGGVLVLGQDQDAVGGGFQAAQAFLGEIDEVRIWNHRRLPDEIAANRTRLLTGAEIGLAGYWPLDQVQDRAAEELTENSRYGILGAGAHWAEEGSDSILVSALTDLEGNYSLSRLRYGTSTAFRVIPNRSPRQFEPAFKTITLSTGSPVQNEVFFTDISSFLVSGFVKFADTDCYSPNIQVLADGVIRGTTDNRGRFAIAVSPGTHEIAFQLDDHTFIPQSLRLNNVEADVVLGEPILDTTLRRLTGVVAGGCGLAVGTLTISVESEDGCLSRTFDASDAYRQDLPPIKYFVQAVSIVPDPEFPYPGDVLEFFDNLGVREVDLGPNDVTLDFRYRAPLSVRVEGLPAPDPTCLLGVPILEQMSRYPLTIRVFEDYGDLGECPVDTGTVTIFDEIIDQEKDPVTLIIKDGEAFLPGGRPYETAANTPNIFAGRRDSQGRDRSYQKSLTAVARVEGAKTVTRTEWVIVTGHRPRTATFTSLAEGVPILILRDPPGDGSTSTSSSSTTYCSKFSNAGLETFSGGFQAKVYVGLSFLAGFGIMTKTSAQAFIEGGLEIGVEATQNRETEVCVSTTEDFSTSSNGVFVGLDGDTYIGLAMNLIFAKTDVLEMNGCNVVLSEAVTYGVDGIETAYNYTDVHIRNVIIPQLEFLARNTPADTLRFNSAIQNWRSHLALNERLKKEALPERNRSFSAGADYAYSTTTTTTETFDWSVKVFTNAELAVSFKFLGAGNGTSNKYYAKLNLAYTRSEGTSNSTSRTVGYTLTDDDIGDYFSVDVKKDPVYGTPVFDVIGGASSCPYEPWPNAQGEWRMQPVEGSQLTVEPPILEDVPPNQPAVFTLSMTNIGEAEQLREYTLYPLQITNPGGAVIKINGIPLPSNGISYFIDPFQTHEVTMTVERGPNKYFYENLEVLMTTPCEFESFRAGGPFHAADTISVDVAFQAPCSDITLLRPLPGWLKKAGEDTVEVILNDFELAISEFDSLELIGAEYRLKDTETWMPIRVFTRNNIPLDAEGNPRSVTAKWFVGALAPGTYEVRAYTKCPKGKGYSGVATGRIDRDPPVVFGIPEPADQVLSLGESIAITFNENIDCDHIQPGNVTLRKASNGLPIVVETVCNGRTIILQTVLPIADFEDEMLTAHVAGIRDLAGNVMTGMREWTFEVQQSKFTWKEGTVSREVPFRNPGSFSAEVVNGLSQKVGLSFTSVASYLTPTGPDSLLPAESALVEFVIQSNLPLGAYHDTLFAVAGPPATPTALSRLVVNLEVTCQPPAWEVDPGSFEHSMTFVYKLSIEGVESHDVNDRVAAYVGGELRGVANLESVPLLGANVHFAFLTVGSNRTTGETVRFRVWDDSACRLYTGSDKSYPFAADGRTGTTESPITLVAQDVAVGSVQTIVLSPGWTWFSLNLQSTTDMSLTTVLGDLNPVDGDILRSKTTYSQYDQVSGWVGGLADLSVTSGYLINLAGGGTIFHEGTPVDPTATPVPVATGWNWIGYTPQGPIATGASLANLLSAWVEGPPRGLIKSQEAFADYTKKIVGAQMVTGWMGGLKTMEPGKGYKLYLSTTYAPNSFKYPVSGPLELVINQTSRAPLEQPLLMGEPEKSRDPGDITQHSGAGKPPAGTALGSEDPLGWVVNPYAYSSEMTVTGVLALDGGTIAPEPEDLVAALINGEVRGLAHPMAVPGYEGLRVFLMVHGEPRDREVEFAIYDADRGRVLGGVDALPFAPDKTEGTVREPWAIHAVTLESPEETGLPKAFALVPQFPNPLRAGTAAVIRYALPVAGRVTVQLFDVQGREVLQLVDGVKPAGWYETSFDPASISSGVYFTRMTAGSFTDTRKVILVN